MSTTRGAGIPAIRSRTDATESAHEWNKMRDAIISIYESNNPTAPNEVSLRLYGFRPIARVDSDSASSTVPGVGITVGRLFFIESNTITTSPGARNKAQEVMPKLNGNDPLDDTIAPRTYLATGDYEAWVIYRELGDTHEARVVFTTENSGPGTLDRDEKAQRLATFSVAYPGGTDASGQQPGVTVKKQFIRDSLQVPTERHQFCVYKTDSDKVKVHAGNFVWLNGPSPKLVSEEVEVPTSAELTVTANGFIYAYGYFTVAQHSQNTVTLSSGLSVTITNYRLSNITNVGFEFRTTEHAAGTNTSSRFSTGNFYYKIAEVELVAGEVFVTNQIANGPIYVNELSDSVLS